jgi:hypothetical protein
MIDDMLLFQDYIMSLCVYIYPARSLALVVPNIAYHKSHRLHIINEIKITMQYMHTTTPPPVRLRSTYTESAIDKSGERR